MNESLQKALDTIIRVADPDKVILFGSQARGDTNFQFSIFNFHLIFNVLKRETKAKNYLYVTNQY